MFSLIPVVLEEIDPGLVSTRIAVRWISGKIPIDIGASTNVADVLGSHSKFQFHILLFTTFQTKLPYSHYQSHKPSPY